MRLPDTPKKLIALSATVLSISLGLCGANFFLVLRVVPLAGPGPQPGQPYPPEWPGDVLSVTGVIELIGIAAGVIGLIVGSLWTKRSSKEDQ